MKLGPRRNQEKALVGAFAVITNLQMDLFEALAHYSPCDQATNNVEDYRHSTHLLGATTLRNVLGTKYLAEILSERSAGVSCQSKSQSNCQSNCQLSV